MMLKKKTAVSFVSILLLSVLCASSISTAFAAKKEVTVSWLSEETGIGGDWVEHYGSYAYILPDTPNDVWDIEIPLGSYSRPRNLEDLINPLLRYRWDPSQYQGLIQGYYKGSSPYWDEWYSEQPTMTYMLKGTKAELENGVVQYPVFAYSWEEGQALPSDPRAVWYPQRGYWKLACWDDGGERGTPLNGWFDINLVIPKGDWKLSIYAYDKERDSSRSTQLYQIFDWQGNLEAEKQIGGTIFNDGVYESFRVICTSNAKITVRVFNDAGYPSTVNVVVSGVFLDAYT